MNNTKKRIMGGLIHQESHKGEEQHQAKFKSAMKKGKTLGEDHSEYH
jgi:hypothetical protein